MTLTVQDSGTTGLVGAIITINNVPIRTVASGIAAFSLDAGTYTAYVTYPGQLFTAYPFTVVDGVAFTHTIHGTTESSGGGSSPGTWEYVQLNGRWIERKAP